MQRHATDPYGVVDALAGSGTVPIAISSRVFGTPNKRIRSNLVEDNV
jgi:hypothetical protein